MKENDRFLSLVDRVVMALKTSLFCVVVALAVFIPVVEGRFPDNLSDVNGGAGCATCSILLGLVDKLTIVYNETVDRSLERLCLFLPAPYDLYCKVATEFLGKFYRSFLFEDNSYW